MSKLSKSDLFTLEAYSEKRPAFRSEVLAHKKNRAVRLGENATLYFEDRLTMQYQIQEMLRIEKIFEAEPIQEELDAYNPLIPDGCNFKATFMLEYADEEVRRVELMKLGGIEDLTWVQVETSIARCSTHEVNRCRTTLRSHNSLRAAPQRRSACRPIETLWPLQLAIIKPIGADIIRMAAAVVSLILVVAY